MGSISTITYISELILCSTISKTRVCSKHFKEEDYHSPDRAGRCLLKEGAIPTVLNWAAASKPRREIIRHIERCVGHENLTKAAL